MSTRSSCAPLSRRTFLTSTTSAAALAAAACAPAPSGGGQSATTSQTQDLIGDGRKRRILLRGGVVLTLDPKVGDFENADVLIDGKTIAQVGPNLAPGDAEVIDCAGTIVMPGFVTTHHHQYRDDSTQHHRGRSACRRLAAGDIFIGRPEHLDGGANRRSRKPEQGHLGSGPCSIRPRGLLHRSAHRLPERDQSGHHNGDGHITVQPHARTHRCHDQGADGFRTPNGVRLQRRDQSRRPGQAFRVPGRDERQHERNRPDREDVFQLEGPTGHAWLRRRPGGSVRRCLVHRMAAWSRLRSVDAQPRKAPRIEDEYGIPFQVFYGVSANTRSAWSIANARRIIGYAPEDDSEVVYADEIREMVLEPARQNMVQGEDRDGKGSR